MLEMKKFQGNAEWVDKVIADCIQKKRFKNDEYYPHDESKRKYWILDDESMEFSSEAELETMLATEDLEVSREHMEQLTAPGGAFDAVPDMQAQGLRHDQVAREHASMNNTSVKGKGRPKGKGTGKNGTNPIDAGSTEPAGNTPASHNSVPETETNKVCIHTMPYNYESIHPPTF